MMVVSDFFWRFRYVENPGALFGLFASLPASARVGVFGVFACLAVVAMAWLSRAGERHHGLSVVASLAAGAAAGNYFDRVRLGYVIDFVEWHWAEVFGWPVFNLVDSALVVGLALLTAWYAHKLWRGEITLGGYDAPHESRLAAAHRAPPPLACSSFDDQEDLPC